MSLLIVLMAPFLVITIVAVHAYAAPVFRGGKLENAVRALMFLTGALCLLGFILLPISPLQATIIGTLGWGVAGPIVFLLLANLFTRIQRPSLARPQRPNTFANLLLNDP